MWCAAFLMPNFGEIATSTPLYYWCLSINLFFDYFSCKSLISDVSIYLPLRKFDLYLKFEFVIGIRSTGSFQSRARILAAIGEVII